MVVKTLKKAKKHRVDKPNSISDKNSKSLFNELKVSLTFLTLIVTILLFPSL